MGDSVGHSARAICAGAARTVDPVGAADERVMKVSQPNPRPIVSRILHGPADEPTNLQWEGEGNRSTELFLDAAANAAAMKKFLKALFLMFPFAVALELTFFFLVEPNWEAVWMAALGMRGGEFIVFWLLSIPFYLPVFVAHKWFVMMKDFVRTSPGIRGWISSGNGMR
jgi:hypothetical protein